MGAAFTLELTLAATLASVPSARCMYREIFHFSSGEQEPYAALRAFSPVLPLALRSCSTTRISHCRVRTSRWFFNRLLRPALCYAFSHPLSVLLALHTQNSLVVPQSRNSTLCFNLTKRWRRSLWPGKLTLVLLLWNMVVPHCLLPETEKPLLSTCYLGFQLCNKILFLFPFVASSQCFSTFLVLWLLNTIPHVGSDVPKQNYFNTTL